MFLMFINDQISHFDEVSIKQLSKLSLWNKNLTSKIISTRLPPPYSELTFTKMYSCRVTAYVF